MNTPHYTMLTPAQRELLCDPQAEEVREEWQAVTDSLVALVSMLSDSYPRPLYYEGEEAEWAVVDAGLASLRGTPFHLVVEANVAAARDLWTQWTRGGHDPALHQLADAYLDELTADSAALRYHPEVPPGGKAGYPVSAGSRRVVGGH